MRKILMIGPFGKPLTGMSVANEMLFKQFCSDYMVQKVDTNFEDRIGNKETQGKFRWKKFFWIVKNIFFQIEELSKVRYDVVYITPGQSLLGIARFFPIIHFAKKKSKVFLHIHGSRFNQIYKGDRSFIQKIIKKNFESIEGVIVLGESLREMVADVIPDNKIFVCENGVQDEVALDKVEATKKNNDECCDRLNVLYLSNLMMDKGILEFLKASESFNEKDVVFNIAGEIEPKVESLVNNYLKKYPDKLFYHGFVSGDEKKRLLRESQVFVLPSKDEGQPISILEAYANACYVITDQTVGGIRDVFCEGTNGYSCSADDYETIVRGIEELPDALNVMKRNYSLYEEKFSEEKFSNRLIEVFFNGE